MKFENLEVIQSYILTTARYDFNVYEKRIMYKLIQIAQADLQGKKLDKSYIKGETLWGAKLITLHYTDLLNDGAKNHARLKNGLLNLLKKVIEYDNPITGQLRMFTMVEDVKMDKRQSILNFRVNPVLWEVILAIGAKGWRKYELETAMDFESVYAMRFYELISNTKEGYIQQFTIEKIKEMFKLVGKYKQINDFVRRVVEPAKKELDLKSPYSFNYKLIKAKGSRKYTSIMIITVPIPQNQNPEIEEKAMQMKSSSTWVVGKETKDYLIRNYAFEEKGIRSNIELFESANKAFDLQKFLSENIRTANSGEIKNKTGWIIGAIRKHLSSINNKKSSKKSDDLIGDLGDNFKFH